MICANCGSKKLEGTSFCGNCGHALLEAEAQESSGQLTEKSELIETLPEDIDAREALDVPETLETPEAQTALEAPEASEAPLAQLSKKKSRILKISLLAASLAIFVFAGAFFYINLPFGIAYSLIYAKDNALFIHSGKDEPSKLVTDEIIDEDADDQWEYNTYNDYLNRGVQFNESGNRMFYVEKVNDDYEASLYYRNPTKDNKDNKKEDKGTRLATRISLNYIWAYQISNSGDAVIYLKDYTYETGGRLYYHDLEKEVLIDRNVKSVYPFSKDGKTIVYTKLREEGKEDVVDLYRKNVDPDSEKVKVDSDIYDVVSYSPNYETIYYEKSNGDPEDLSDLTLYVKRLEEDRKRLFSGYTSIVSTDVDGDGDGVFLFKRNSSKPVNLYSLVEDDFKTKDESIVEPLITDFEKTISYTDWWGDVYDQIEVDYDAYYEAQDVYYAKYERDLLRDELKNNTVDDTISSLYIYENGKEKRWAEGIANDVYYNASAQVAMYHKRETNNSEKLLLSNITSTYDVKEHFWDNNALTDSAYYIIKGGEEKKLSSKQPNGYTFHLSEDKKQLFFIEGTIHDNSGALVTWAIEGNELTNKQELDAGVYELEMINNVIWYYKDVKNYSAELLRWEKGTVAAIADDVHIWYTTFYEEDDVVMYLSDYKENRGMGTLFMYKNNEHIEIAQDVAEYAYWDPSNIYYIADYRMKTRLSDLWFYGGPDNNRLVDESISHMLPLKYGYTF